MGDLSNKQISLGIKLRVNKNLNDQKSQHQIFMLFQVVGSGLWTVPEGLFCGLPLLSSLNLSSNHLQARESPFNISLTAV
jgi:hypothetical protein